MPTRTYMVIDQRHDHSFRIPRPDLSVKLGTPNTCNGCHADQSPEWAASAIERWHGPNRKGFQTFAAALQAAWTGKADAARLLAQVAADRGTPAIARATALTELGSRLTQSTIALIRTSLSDPDPMVRIGALDALEGVPVAQRGPLASALLGDAVQGVRTRAAYVLAGMETARLSAPERERFEGAAQEFVAAMKFNADRPESRSMLGSFYCDAAPRRRPRPSSKPRCGSAGSTRPPPSIWPIFIGSSAVKPTASASCARRSPTAQKMPAFTTRSA